MTLIIYEPEVPALEVIGHAGFGQPGRDIVCAACSILLYTLLDACPEAENCLGDGYARLDGAKLPESRGSFALIARGDRLLAENYPGYIMYREKKHYAGNT